MASFDLTLNKNQYSQKELADGAQILKEEQKSQLKEQEREEKRIEVLADAYVQHYTNEKGEVLSNMFESPAFQEMYDYHGVEKKRGRLGRKHEQIWRQFDEKQKLFQKVLYHPQLIRKDEEQLARLWSSLSEQHDNLRNYSFVAGCLAFLPAVYRVSGRVSPTATALFSVAYFGSLHFLDTKSNDVLQYQLNQEVLALKLHEKYQIKFDKDYTL